MEKMTLEEIKALIKKERKLQGISQNEIAEKLGISQVAYSKFEVSDKPLPVKRLHEVAQILNIDTLLFESKENIKEDILESINSQLIIMNETLKQIANSLDNN